MQKYPDSFPTDAAEQIIKSFRGGTLVADAAPVAESAWNLAGYGLSQTLGESLPADGPELTDEEAVTKLEQAVKSQNAQVAANDPELRGGFLSAIFTAQMLKWAIGFAVQVLQGIDKNIPS